MRNVFKKLTVRFAFEGSMSGRRKVQKSNPTTSILRMGDLSYLLLFLILGITQEVNRLSSLY